MVARLFSSPDGQKFRSKPQLQAHFGDKLDLTDFDFRTGGQIPSGKKKRSTRAGSPRLRSMKGLPKNKTPPSRVICGLVRQPVTCVLPQSHDFRKTTPADILLRESGQPLKPLPQQRFCMKRLDQLVVYSTDGSVVEVTEKNKVDVNGEAENEKGDTTNIVNGHETKMVKSSDDKGSNVAPIQQVNGEQKKTVSAPPGIQTQRMSQTLLSRMQQEAPAMSMPFLAQPAIGGYSHIPVSYPFPMMHSTVGYPQLLPYHMGAVGHTYPPMYNPGHTMFHTPHTVGVTERFQSLQMRPVDWVGPPLQSHVADPTDPSLETAEEEMRKQEERVRQIRERLEAARLKSGQNA